jgi:hypothetical protein
MKIFLRTLLLASLPVVSVPGYSQAVPAPAAPAAVDTTKQIASMEAKLAD